MSYNHANLAKKLDLKNVTKSILICFAEHADKENDSCWPSYKRVAFLVGVSRQTVINHVKILIDLTLMVKRIRYEKNVYGAMCNTTNMYTLALENGKILNTKMYTTVVNDVDSNHSTQSIQNTKHKNNADLNKKSVSSNVEKIAQQSIVTTEPVNQSLPPITPDTIHDRSSLELNRSFNVFWDSGLLPFNKERCMTVFKRIARQGDESYQSLAERLSVDVKRRFNLRQFGFDTLSPYNYLSKSRFDDALPRSRVLSRKQRMSDGFNKALVAAGEFGAILSSFDTKTQVQTNLEHGRVFEHEQPFIECYS